MKQIKDKTYVMFGFKKSNENKTGYFSKELTITKSLSKAKRFIDSKKLKNNKKYGTPKQWLDFINTDNDLNHGYKFHLVCIEERISNNEKR